MLHELDSALRALVERDIAGNGEVAVDFDAPTKEWAAHRNQPTIDIYLYDIRQDLSRSAFGEVDVRGPNGNITERRPQPKFFRLAYLVTAWTQRAEDEHRLLSALLVTFLRHETVPMELLDGSLADLGISIPLAVALPPPQDRALSDVWSALGGELKPSLDVSVIAPLLPERFGFVGPPVLIEPVLKVIDQDTEVGELIGGRPMPDDRAPGILADRRPPPRPVPPPQPRGTRRRARS
jgi:Pvc16 N-terminal domain